MKPILLSLVIALSLITGFAVAGDRYVATLTGIECSGCKKTIAKSLSKINAVKTIRIEKNENGTHKMTVTTDGSAQVTKSQAVAAIKRADHYQITSWSRVN